MRHSGIFLLAVLTAACGQSGAIRPGMWETTMTMSAGDAELWRSTVERCLYDDEAANPGSSLFKAGQLHDCKVSKSTFADGSFTVEASCPGRPSAMADVPMTPDWMASSISIRGKYSATTMDGPLAAELNDTLEPMKFNGQLKARRTGDC